MLLSRNLKRNARALAAVALVVLCAALASISTG